MTPSIYKEGDHIRWEDCDPGEGYLHLPAYIDLMLELNKRRYQDYVRYAALYGNWEMVQSVNSMLMRTPNTSRSFRRLSFNICQSMTDTVANQRAASQNSVMAMSSDGDYKQFVRAKMFTKAVKEELTASGWDMIFPRFVQNAAIFGRGYATVDRLEDGLKARRIFTPEMVTNPFDNTCDDWPYVISHVRYVNKWKLISKYEHLREEILQASVAPESGRTEADENVRVDESWICARNGKPGKHMACIRTADLIPIEDYAYDTPPFVSLAWGMPLQGWESQGLIDQLMGLQLEITETLDIAHQAIQLFAHPFMLVEQGSNLNKAEIQDVPGRILSYANTKPDIVAPSLLSPEVYQHIERCYSKGYEIAGINMLDAGAKTLARYESSKAMGMAKQSGEVRHFSFATNADTACVDMARLIAREAAILGDEKDYKTKLPHSAYFKSIPWREINADLDKFKIDIDTVNKSSDSIASKIQDLEDLAQLQQLTVSELRSYLLNPDINRVLNHITASDEYINWVIYKICYEENEDMMPPNPYMDQAAAFKDCVAELLNGIRIGMTAKAQELLTDYIVGIKTNIDEAQQEQMQMQLAAQQQAQMMKAPVQAQLPSSNQAGSQQ